MSLQCRVQSTQCTLSSFETARRPQHQAPLLPLLLPPAPPAHPLSPSTPLQFNASRAHTHTHAHTHAHTTHAHMHARANTQKHASATHTHQHQTPKTETCHKNRNLSLKRLTQTPPHMPLLRLHPKRYILNVKRQTCHTSHSSAMRKR